MASRMIVGGEPWIDEVSQGFSSRTSVLSDNGLELSISGLGSILLVLLSLVVLVLALIVVTIGVIRGGGGRVGERLGESASRLDPAPLSDCERHEVLNILRQLTTWSGDYGAAIAKYQERLGDLSAETQRHAGITPPPQVLPRVVDLLEEMMRSNSQLQQQLAAAEKQLRRQTGEIESYVTEARTDGLTTLANRRSFDAKIEQLVAAHDQGGASFVLMMIDIDHFKRINDAYGHPSGDEVLQGVASALRRTFPDAHLLARYGGEEFAVILPGPLQLAAERADRMRSSLSDQPMEIADQAMRVTLSCGLSELDQARGGEQWIRRADQALYAAKHGGRNRVCYHDGHQSRLFGAAEPAEPTT